uniref:Ig-like domain-containing protein n=1 Tax=Amphilophus citrinellus TaxID=61819 RepID=A0A3Q0QSD8_AMPCI
MQPTPPLVTYPVLVYILFHQVPSSVLESLHGHTTISCNHSVSSYNIILWYQKPRGGSALKLIGHILYTNPTVEGEFQQTFNISGDGAVKSQLHVQKLKAEDSSVYYCYKNLIITTFISDSTKPLAPALPSLQGWQHFSN